MIIIPKQTVPFLLAGRVIEVKPQGGSYRKGRLYTVWTKHEDQPKKRVARARVVAIDGDQIAIVRSADATPRFLAASMGRANYVSDPKLGAEGEPEALSAEEQEAMSKPARERDDIGRRERAAHERQSRWRNVGSRRAT